MSLVPEEKTLSIEGLNKAIKELEEKGYSADFESTLPKVLQAAKNYAAMNISWREIEENFYVFGNCFACMAHILDINCFSHKCCVLQIEVSHGSLSNRPSLVTGEVGRLIDSGQSFEKHLELFTESQEVYSELLKVIPFRTLNSKDLFEIYGSLNVKMVQPSHDPVRAQIVVDKLELTRIQKVG